MTIRLFLVEFMGIYKQKKKNCKKPIYSSLHRSRRNIKAYVRSRFLLFVFVLSPPRWPDDDFGGPSAVRVRPGGRRRSWRFRDRIDAKPRSVGRPRARTRALRHRRREIGSCHPTGGLGRPGLAKRREEGNVGGRAQLPAVGDRVCARLAPPHGAKPLLLRRAACKYTTRCPRKSHAACVSSAWLYCTGTAIGENFRARKIKTIIILLFCYWSTFVRFQFHCLLSKRLVRS